MTNAEGEPGRAHSIDGQYRALNAARAECAVCRGAGFGVLPGALSCSLAVALTASPQLHGPALHHAFARFSWIFPSLNVSTPRGKCRPFSGLAPMVKRHRLFGNEDCNFNKYQHLPCLPCLVPEPSQTSRHEKKAFLSIGLL
jgi:hypothetical protein